MNQAVEDLLLPLRPRASRKRVAKHPHSYRALALPLLRKWPPELARPQMPLLTVPVPSELLEQRASQATPTSRKSPDCR